VMKNDYVHINWGACKDWENARSRLVFLGVTLFGNFCDVHGNATNIRRQLLRRGFKVERDEVTDEKTKIVRHLLRISDIEPSGRPPP